MGYIKEYNDYVSKIEEKKKEICKLISQKDLEQQDILHYLEFEKCNAATSARLMKRLKSLRAERRAVKDDLDELNKVLDKIGHKAIKDPKPKKYTYRTSIIKDIFG